MFVKLTMLPQKVDLYLRIEDIKTIQRNPENQLETIVSVNIMTPKGPFGYLVGDAPESIVTQMLAGGYHKVAN